MKRRILDSIKSTRLYRRIREIVSRQIFHYKANKYNKTIPGLIDKIASKDQINIIFFIHSLAYWKYDGLVRLLKENPRFKIFLVPFINPAQDTEISKKFQENIIGYCDKNEFPIYLGYDFESNKFNDINKLSPDIIVYTHPYNVGYKGWLIDNFKNKCLFFYTPYGANVTKGSYFFDTYLTNVAFKLFMGSKLEIKEFSKYLKVSKDKYSVTGFTVFDEIREAKGLNSVWLGMSKKRIIWAPHHSIDNKLSFSSSNFERICENMLNLATKYKDSIELAFKPHPLLKTRLYEKWGKEKTEEYYKRWEEMENSFVCTEDYAVLFAQSDGLIHDCASFACEYLLTGKPAFYICKGDKPQAGIDNEFGLECFKQHYHGYTIIEIERFICDIINGYDPKYHSRNKFVKDFLLPSNDKSVSENMYEALISTFNHER